MAKRKSLIARKAIHFYGKILSGKQKKSASCHISSYTILSRAQNGLAPALIVTITYILPFLKFLK